MMITNDVIKNFEPLWRRMDEDLNLYYIEKFFLEDKAGKPLEDVSNITLNDPRVFGDAAMAILSLDKRTTDITGVDASIQDKLEQEIEKYLYVNDESLSDELIEPLDTCFNFFSLFRGWIGALPLMYKDGDKYLPTIRPLDPRWMTWEVGKKGFRQASYRFRVGRLEAEETYKKTLGTKADVELSCVWDDKEFNIFQSTDGRIASGAIPLKTVTHNLGFCPVIVVPVPTQPLLIGTGKDYGEALSRQGESVYAPVRTLIPALNEVASIWATINKQQFMTPLAYTGTRDLKGESIFGFGIVVQLNENEKLEPIPLRDMTPSAQALFGQLFARWERATMSSVNFGQLSFELSALAVADVKSDRDKVIVPRRKVKTVAYRKICSALRRQITEHCFEADIDKEDAIEIDKDIFKDKFSVNFTYDSISPQENIANAQLAQQLKAIGFPDEWIFRNVMRVEDPSGMLRDAKLQRLYSILPTLELADAAIGLAPGDVTEERINQIKAKLIFKALEDQLTQTPVPIENPPNLASQPKADIYPGRASSEKLAAAQAERTGQATIQKGRQAKVLGESK